MNALRLGNLAWLRNLGRAWRGLLFPPACLGCGEGLDEGEFLCPACARQVQPPPAPLCRQCGAPLAENGGLCPGCRLVPPAFAHARAVALHHGPLAEAVRRFKYDGRYALGPGLAALLAREAPPELLGWADLAAPVPLHPWRLLRRGFNQAQVLARGLEKTGGLTVAPRLLQRLRHTRPQVGLPPRERAANVAGAFGVNPRLAHLAQGRRVLLLDDVLTTGATVGECARVLLAAGAAEVSVLTLTRAAAGREGG
jgi:ComF family protein